MPVVTFSCSDLGAKMKAVWRKPQITSKKLSWAPGWGRSLRTTTLEPLGQDSKSSISVTSATQAPSRTSPSSVSMASHHSSSSSSSMASRTSWVMGNPKLKATPRVAQ